MAVDPQLQALGVQLADAALRNGAGAITTRIGASKAKKREQETIAELEEIVGELLADKNELVRIAQAYEQELVAQRISEDDIEYISTNFVPLLKQVLEKTGPRGTSGQEIIDLLQPILSVETVTVLQLIGFNFRKGIGEPLTELVSRAILSKAAPDPAVARQVTAPKGSGGRR